MNRRAQRDAQTDMGNPSTACKHPGPWDSIGPIKENGQSYTLYTCPECDKEMRRHYY